MLYDSYNEYIIRLHQLLLLLMCAVSVCQSVGHAASLLPASLCGGHSVQPLPNHIGLLFRE